MGIILCQGDDPLKLKFLMFSKYQRNTITIGRHRTKKVVPLYKILFVFSRRYSVPLLESKRRVNTKGNLVSIRTNLTNEKTTTNETTSVKIKEPMNIFIILKIMYINENEHCFDLTSSLYVITPVFEPSVRSHFQESF